MFGKFKKKSPLEILQKEYARLSQRSYEWSTKNRAQSDKYYAEAQEIADKIEALKSKS